MTMKSMDDHNKTETNSGSLDLVRVTQKPFTKYMDLPTLSKKLMTWNKNKIFILILSADSKY